MSRLSRFKKGPSIKLPKKLPQRSRFEDDSDDDDDDFVSRPTKSSASSSSRNATPKADSKSPTVEPSVSEYFQPSTSKVVRERNPTSSSKPDAASLSSKTRTQKKEHSTKQKENSEKKAPARSIAASSTESRKPQVKAESEAVSTNESEKSSAPCPSESDNDSETQGKVVCPFCWKKLGDKLTGTTHVKACAKDVPIQRVFEAMQLQEKQIEEWEKLGLEFPGFSTTNNNKKTKTASGAPRSRGGGGRSRKKKADPASADPEFELAVALSMSLHEELESRQTKENEFLIENGLEKEIGLVDVKPKVAVTKDAGNVKSTYEVQVPVVATASRRRGKKLPLDQMPLYAVNTDRKKEIICERVTRILDESEKDKNQEFYIREEIPSDAFGVPKNLVQFQDKESTLWTRAQGSEDIPNESFSVLELPDPKDMTLGPVAGGSETPNYLSSDDLASDNQVNEDIKALKDECVVIDHIPTKPTRPKEPETKCKITEVATKGLKCSHPSGSTSSSTQSSLSGALKHLPRIIQDITEMLLLRKDCDLVIYGREEKAIKCHSFMIGARCPKLLKDVVEENCGKHTRRMVPLTNFSHRTVKSFLWYIYTGELDYDEDLMTEVRDLASTYDMVIDASKGQRSEKFADSCSVEIQTDSVITQDSSSMTESLCKNSVETGFESLEDSKVSQELFTTFCDDGHDTVLGNKCETTTKNEQPENSDQLCFENSENEDTQSDVDLFEDIENDLNNPISPCQQQVVVDEEPVQVQPVMDESLLSVQSNHEEELFDEDGLMKELATPPLTPSGNSSEKKRSRSVSPIVEDSQGLYSATQVAGLLHRRLGGGGYVKNKANKKQKLDISDVEMICDENNHNDPSDVKVNEKVDFESSGNGDKWKDDSIFSNLLNVTTPKSNRLKSRRSVSTPNLSIKQPNNNSSPPFYNQQTSASFDEVDPFADACDDSVFANIPDEILMKKKTPEATRTMSTFHKDVDVSKCTSQTSLTPRSRSRRRPSPRDLSKCDDTFSTNKRGARKGRANGKAKEPKIKLPAKLPPKNKEPVQDATDMTCEISHREDTFLSQQHPPVSKPTAESTRGGDSKSPMLNYSLIDTPILKQELKKFGIKPLPRSKAKVLLRHIYKETHK